METTSIARGDPPAAHGAKSGVALFLAAAVSLFAACGGTAGPRSELGSGKADGAPEGSARGKENTMKALVLVDDGWGANLTIEDGFDGILAQLEGFGWELVLASPGGAATPCPVAARSGGKAMPPQVRVSDLAGAEGFDAVVVAPGRAHEGLVADKNAMALLRDARDRGLAIAAFCRGARVLAAADVVRGARMTGHPDYLDQYRAAGALYVDYADRAGKSDAPPPVVDGFLVTVMRAKYYRSAGCEAIRIAAENARRARLGAPVGHARQPGAARPAEAARSAAFAFPVDPGTGKEALLLVGSLRALGGTLGASRAAAFCQGGRDALPAELAAALDGYGCDILEYERDPRFAALPFAEKADAAAAAERWALGKADVLVWADTDTVFLREPTELLLPAGAVVAARPVHHRLIGSAWNEDPDAYWRAVYGEDMLPALFPVTTIVDRQAIRPYLNAGLLSFRPEAGLAARWIDEFGRLIKDPSVALAMKNNPRRALFLHQAALAAAIVRTAGAGGFMELSYGYNYPLHLHASAPKGLAPGKLDDLYTLRYDQWKHAPLPGSSAVPLTAGITAAFSAIDR